MEQLVYQNYTIALAVLLPFLLLLLTKFKASSSKIHAGVLQLPPGPSLLPIIGSIHHFLSSLPHHAMHDLSQRYGPLMLLRLGEVPTIVVSSAEAAEEVLKTHDVAFASRPITITTDILTYNAKNVGFAPYGEHWRQLRKIYIQELMSPKRVQSFRFIREEEVARLICSISSAAASPPIQLVNLTKKFYALTNDVAVRAAIGSKCTHRDMYLQEMMEVLKLMGGFNLADLFPSSVLALWLSPSTYTAKRCHKRIHRIFESIIEERKYKTTIEEDNLLDVLLRQQREGGLQFPLTNEIISAALVDIFLAGTETTEATLQWAMSELVRNPLIMERAQSEVRQALQGKATVTEEDLNELHYLRLVIKETLRLHPAAPLITRECREASRIMGYDIPEGFSVLVNAWAIGRDPRHWVNAEEFQPERFEDSTSDYKGSNTKYVPFGAGRRTCPGASFGLANIELTLASLLFHFNWELPSGVTPDTLDMTEAFGFSAPRKHYLLLRAVPHIPCRAS